MLDVEQDALADPIGDEPDASDVPALSKAKRSMRRRESHAERRELLYRALLQPVARDLVQGHATSLRWPPVPLAMRRSV